MLFLNYEDFDRTENRIHDRSQTSWPIMHQTTTTERQRGCQEEGQSHPRDHQQHYRPSVLAASPLQQSNVVDTGQNFDIFYPFSDPEMLDLIPNLDVPDFYQLETDPWNLEYFEADPWNNATTFPLISPSEAGDTQS